MGKELIVLLLLVVVIAIIVVYKNTGWYTKEAFETIMDKVQDRANPLAAQTHPLYNPAANYGIPESSGADLKAMNLTALNTALEQRTNTSDITSSNRTIRLSPRIDNENSFLGIVKFCKETAEKYASMSPPGNPFTDATFAQNCGVCVGAGKFITGDSFNESSNNGRGVGVVVYEEDKKRAYDKQKRNEYKYPRAIPSLDAAQCANASLSDDTIAPVLAINTKMYSDILKRSSCIKNSAFNDDHSCGLCMDGTDKVWSYVKSPFEPQIDTTLGEPIEVNAPINPIYLDLYGVGLAKVTVIKNVNKQAGSSELPITEIGSGSSDYVPLSINTPLKFNISDVPAGNFVEEGDHFYISIKVPPDAKGNPTNTFVYVGGILYGKAAPNNTITKVYLESIYLTDLKSGTRTARGPSLATAEDVIKTFKQGSTASIDEKIKLDCIIPLTFISNQWDENHPQIAYYDCQNNPYVTSLESKILFETKDACMRDQLLAKQGVGSGLSAECLQGLIVEAGGCSTAGTWWQNPQSISNDVKAANGDPQDPASIRAYLKKKTQAKDDEYNEKCLGINLKSDCDKYLDGGVPDVKCMRVLYNNQLSENTRIAAMPASKGMPGNKANVYGNTENFLNYRSLNLNTDEYCRSTGKLNPANPKGRAILEGVATTGYGGYTGIDAIKKYLQDTYNRAVNSSLDVNLEDKDGGRKTSWDLCFGIELAKPEDLSVNSKIPKSYQANRDISVNYNCTVPPGYPVYVDADAEVGGRNVWTSDFVYARPEIRPPLGSDCYWIWAEPGYTFYGTTISSGKKYTFRYNFCNTYGYAINAQVVGGIDDQGSVRINGRRIFTGTQSFGPINVTLPGGNNGMSTIEMDGVNGGGPGGVWLAIYATINGKKTYLVTTNSKWVYTAA